MLTQSPSRSQVLIQTRILNDSSNFISFCLLLPLQCRHFMEVYLIHTVKDGQFSDASAIAAVCWCDLHRCSRRLGKGLRKEAKPWQALVELEHSAFEVTVWPMPTNSTNRKFQHYEEILRCWRVELYLYIEIFDELLPSLMLWQFSHAMSRSEWKDRIPHLLAPTQKCAFLAVEIKLRALEMPPCITHDVVCISTTPDLFFLTCNCSIFTSICPLPPFL